MTERSDDVAESLWTAYAVANWVLIGLFGVLTVAHVVLTVLFYLGVHDQGFGYIFGVEWPSWLITIGDASAAVMLWLGYKRGVEAPWLGLLLTAVAAVIMWGRADWMVFVPVLIVISIVGSVVRILVTARTSEVRT